MKLAFAADHAGVELKNTLKVLAEKAGHSVRDFGTNTTDSVDYPDFAHQAAQSVICGESDLGIFVCGSGTGMAISANKNKGIRAANCWAPEIASLARQHNNANVLCVPARFISEAEARAVFEAFLTAEFEGGRHQNRVNKIENC